MLFRIAQHSGMCVCVCVYVLYCAQELRVHGHTVIDGLVTKDLAAQVKATALNLHRKGERAHTQAVLVPCLAPCMHVGVQRWQQIGGAQGHSVPDSKSASRRQEIKAEEGLLAHSVRVCVCVCVCVCTQGGLTSPRVLRLQRV